MAVRCGRTAQSTTRCRISIARCRYQQIVQCILQCAVDNRQPHTLVVLLKAAPAAPAPTNDTYCSGPRGVGAWAGDEASGAAGNIYEMPLIQSRLPTTRGPEQYVSLIGAGAAGAAGAAFSNTQLTCDAMIQTDTFNVPGTYNIEKNHTNIEPRQNTST